MPTWRVWGERFETADMSGTRIHQPVIFHRDVSLLACRAWLIFYNSPTIANFTMKVYSDNDGSPGVLLNTSSTVWEPASVYTLSNAVKEVYFEWNTPVFKSEDVYHFVINGSGYVGSTSSHISWKNTFPDPPYKLNVDLSYKKLLINPFDLTFVGNHFK